MGASDTGAFMGTDLRPKPGLKECPGLLFFLVIVNRHSSRGERPMPTHRDEARCDEWAAGRDAST
jgi:hypothetical protein